MFLSESESIAFENDTNNRGCYLTEKEVTEKLKYVIHEPRDATRLRVVLLARGGHFAGCIFDGNSVVAHKTFHRLEASPHPSGAPAWVDIRVANMTLLFGY